MQQRVDNALLGKRTQTAGVRTHTKAADVLGTHWLKQSSFKLCRQLLPSSDK